MMYFSLKSRSKGKRVFLSHGGRWGPKELRGNARVMLALGAMRGAMVRRCT
jgi:hypothetical protein